MSNCKNTGFLLSDCAELCAEDKVTLNGSGYYDKGYDTEFTGEVWTFDGVVEFSFFMWLIADRSTRRCISLYEIDMRRDEWELKRRRDA